MSSLDVKGGSIRTKLEYLSDTFGEGAREELVTLLKKRDAYPVLEANWYAFELFDEVLRFVADRFLGGDLARLEEVGRYSARRSLTGVYGNFRRADFGEFLRRRLPLLHGRYYSAGKLDVIQLSESGCRLRLTAPVYRESDLYVASGFYRGAAETMGHADVSCCFEIKDDRVYYLLRWKAAPSL